MKKVALLMLFSVYFLISVSIAAADFTSAKEEYSSILTTGITETTLSEITIINKGEVFGSLSVPGERIAFGMSNDIPLLEFIDDKQMIMVKKTANVSSRYDYNNQFDGNNMTGRKAGGAGMYRRIKRQLCSA